VKLLLVDGDPDEAAVLAYALRLVTRDVIVAQDPGLGLRIISEQRPDLVLLDLDGPRTGALDLLTELQRHHDIRIVLLVGPGDVRAGVAGLEAGADDYLTRPFGHRELVARVRAHLRRARQSSRTAPLQDLCVGPLRIDVQQHIVWMGKQQVPLTPTEFRLLQTLAEKQGTLVERGILLSEVWGFGDPIETGVVRATIHRLRRKLEADPNWPRLIHVSRGAGVMLNHQAATPNRHDTDQS
jgi:DNA-binding response OmpR family regulator